MTEILFLRLPTMARAINLKVKGYTAIIEKVTTSTDRKVRGSRVRIPGKGREGNRLIVINADGVKMFDHDASRGGRNDSVAFTIEKLWGPIWDKDCLKGKPLVCAGCKTQEDTPTRGHYTYNAFTYKVLCPDCNAKYEKRTL
jgi:hypothetical protein